MAAPSQTILLILIIYNNDFMRMDNEKINHIVIDFDMVHRDRLVITLKDRQLFILKKKITHVFLRDYLFLMKKICLFLN